MARIIAIANQKGGVGKTTTAVNLASCLAILGRKVLLIDMDPQGNASSGLGIPRVKIKHCIYNALIDGMPLKILCQTVGIANLEVVPATVQLAGAEVQLVQMNSREHRLDWALQGLLESAQYDYVLIDCPPSLGMLTINSLVAARTLIIPMQCEYYALEGLGQLMNTVSLVQRHLNRSLTLEGILLTMFDARTNLAIQVVDEVKRHFRGRVFQTIIPRNVRLSEAPSHGLPVVIYDPRSRGAEVYGDLAREVDDNG